ncbi:ATP-binding protein [Haloferax volcanii]|uniref:ATP-binding protein n=1 Tax=Haloferax volcanii TaxID=2246 RepID=A0A847TZ30_HALVO|nr:ATP-binding protein [Haloferax alexandrinus]NLV03871.1 ATP-binding protein [Haloferax alexandrinus]
MSPPDSKRLLDFASRYDVLDEEEIRELILASGMSQNEVLQEVASRVVAARAVDNSEYPFASRSTTGEITLGDTFEGRRFRLSEDDLVRHLLAVGQSGSGKTTLFFNLLGQVGVPFWVFDLKRDYRPLARQDQVLVLPWSELKLNPLRPPSGVSPRRWAQVFSEIFGHATSLLSGSKNYLLKKIIELYDLYGLFEEVSGPYPGLHELQLLVENDSMSYVRTAADYRDRLLNRLEAMNLTAGTVFECSQGPTIEELLDRRVVFEFDGLSRDVQNFLMEILFAGVYEYRLGQGMRGDELRHLFLLDEGKQVFSVYKERQDAAGIPEIDQLTAKMREFGEGLVVGDQEASKLTDSIKANTYTKFLLPTGDRKQFQAVTNSMNLSERQTEFASELEVGEAVVQVGNRSPVPVKLDNHEVDKQISDKELQKLQAKNWNSLSYEPRDTTPEFEVEILEGRSGEVPEPDTPEDPTREVNVSSEADRLLKDVVENPFRPLTQRYQSFSSRYKGNKAKNELVDEGVLIERQVRTKSGRRKLLELTKKGRQYVEDELDLEANHRGRGGVVHRYWQHRIKEVFEEAGWYAETEVFDADVYVNMDTAELVVEVAMGDNPREIEHIEKHLEKDFIVWVAARNQEILEGLQQRMMEKGLQTDNVVFRPVRDFNEIENLPE